MDFIVLFAAGTFWFWLLLITSFILISLAVEYDHGIKAFLVMFVTLLIFHFANDSLIFKWIAENPGHLIAYLLGYLVIGTFWTYIKWYLFVLKRKEEEIERQNSGYSNINHAPNVQVYKNKIIRWMVYWPFSAIITTLNDPLKRLFEVIFSWISSSLQSISDKMWSSIKKHEEILKEKK